MVADKQSMTWSRLHIKVPQVGSHVAIAQGKKTFGVDFDMINIGAKYFQFVIRLMGSEKRSGV